MHGRLYDSLIHISIESIPLFYPFPFICLPAAPPQLPACMGDLQIDFSVPHFSPRVTSPFPTSHARPTLYLFYPYVCSGTAVPVLSTPMPIGRSCMQCPVPCMYLVHNPPPI